MQGGQEKGKDSIPQKSKSEEKVVGFRSVLLFPARKWEPVSHPGPWNHLTRGIRPPDAEENPGSWENKQDCRCITDKFM